MKLEDKYLALISALDFNGKKLNAPEKGLDDEWSGWVRLDATKADCREALVALLPDVDEVIIGGLLTDETRPRIEEIDSNSLSGGLMMILRAANYNPGKNPHDMAAIRIWADGKRFVTIQRQSILTLEDVQKKIERPTVPVMKTGMLLAAICNRLLERLEPALRELDDSIAQLEDKVFHDADHALSEQLSGYRRQAMVFKRHIAPQLEVLGRLRTLPLPWIEEQDRFFFADAHDHFLRFVEGLDAVRDRCQIMREELNVEMGNILNQRMYTLSIVSVIFLPLGVLTGLLGVNLAGIPFAENPDAFNVFGGLLIAVVVLVLALLKKRKWF